MVRKSLVVLVAVLVAAIPTAAQTGWMKNYGGEGSETGWVVEQTTDGGYFVLGTTSSFGAGEADIWLLKTDSSGDTLWTKTYGGSLTEWASSGQLTSDGGCIIAGYTESFGAGKYDIWLLKTDSSGDTVWTQTYGDTGYEEANSVQRTTDGGYIITGYNNGVFNEEYGYVRPGDIWLIKTDDGGNLLWEKTYGTPEDEYEEGMCVRQTSDGGYIVGCYGLDDPATLSKARLMKTDASGDTVWIYRTSANRWFDCVEETLDGEYIIAGNFNIADLGLAKISETGSLLWEKTYGDPAPVNDWANGLAETSDGGYIVTGLYAALFPGGSPKNGDLWLLKTDENGDTLWTRTYGKNPQFDFGNCVRTTSDGGYIVTGITKSYTNGDYDLWLIKTDEYGMISVAEEPGADAPADWQVLSPIGHSIVLRYEDRPQGFSASVFDASGRKVDEIHASQASGTIIWGDTQTPGVYFIRSSSDNTMTTRKVILVK